MTDKEALKLALGALENFMKFVWSDPEREGGFVAIDAIKEALDECDEDELIIQYHEATIKRLENRIDELMAQPAQEPVAWMFQHEETGRTMCVDTQQLEWGFEKGNPRLKKIAPLYTALQQRPWVGLTDEEINICWDELMGRYDYSREMVYRAIEAKLKEMNA